MTNVASGSVVSTCPEPLAVVDLLNTVGEIPWDACVVWRSGEVSGSTSATCSQIDAECADSENDFRCAVSPSVERACDFNQGTWEARQRVLAVSPSVERACDFNVGQTARSSVTGSVSPSVERACDFNLDQSYNALKAIVVSPSVERACDFNCQEVLRPNGLTPFRPLSRGRAIST